jgi:hypothetical protein
MTTRAVPIDSAQQERMERLGMDLMRKGSYEDATMLLSLALAWKVAPVVRFSYHVDESGGLAEVHELSSRKPW